ncbi:MAG: ASCH domain-containing protein [Anaerolineae bacterium]|nr:ASCH domain-containing protein [Anaerolineae bacterium]
MPDELGQRVLQGTKTATAGLLRDFEALPQVGDVSLILDGQAQPLCLLETLQVYPVPFEDVDAEQAWREGHWRFFGQRCAEIGRQPKSTMPVVCQRFRLPYPLRSA